MQQYRCQQQHTWTATIIDTVHHEIATLRCTSGRKRAHLPSFTREIPSARSGQLRIKRRIHWLIGVNTGVTTRYYNAVLTPNQPVYTQLYWSPQRQSTSQHGDFRRGTAEGGSGRSTPYKHSAPTDKFDNCRDVATNVVVGVELSIPLLSQGVPGIHADPSFSEEGRGQGLKFDSLPYINWTLGLLSISHFYPWITMSVWGYMYWYIISPR